MKTQKRMAIDLYTHGPSTVNLKVYIKAKLNQAVNVRNESWGTHFLGDCTKFDIIEQVDVYFMHTALAIVPEGQGYTNLR